MFCPFNKIQNIEGILLIPQKDTTSNGLIKSRFCSTKIPAISFDEKANLYELISSKRENKKFVIIDESNFLTKKQVDELGQVVDNLNVNVLCYGLMTNFKGELFEGSKRLVEIADKMEHIYVRSLCKCGKVAVFNARFIDGKFSENGEEIIIDKKNKQKSKVKYIPMCRKWFNLLIKSQ